MSRSTSILGIDFGYALAILGCMFVNTIFIIGGKLGALSHVDYFVILDFFPALFFFLNGTTVALSMRDKRVSSRRLLAYLGKRGSVLALVGILFSGSWPMNLFIASGFFFITSPFFSQWSNLVLRMIIIVLSLFAVMLINADVHTYPVYSGLQLQGSGMGELASFVFFNGYYSFLPWSIFFLAGILYGRGDMRPRGYLPPSSVVAVLAIVASFFIQMYAAQIQNEQGIEVTQPEFPFRPKFLLPAFIVFTLGALWLFMNVAIHLFRHGLPTRITKMIQFLSGSKYSIYLFQLIVGFIIVHTFNLIVFEDPLVLIIFTLLFISLCIWLVALWRNKLDDAAPMEKLIKRISGSAKKA